MIHRDIPRAASRGASCAPFFRALVVLAAALALAGVAGALSAQESAPSSSTTAAATDPEATASEAAEQEEAEEQPQASVFFETTVTATLSEVDAFKIPQSVSVIEEIEEVPVDNVAELIVAEPGSR